MPDFYERTADLSEAELQRAYRASALTAYVGGIASLINLTLAIATIVGHGVHAGLLSHIGAAMFAGGAWFSGAFRTAILTRRSFDVRPLDVLRSPSDWFPSPFSNIATVGGSGDGVQLLPAVRNGNGK
ncbi:hypothetical protein [Paraburkholderia tropica]|uniref:hypothetical protein n=1 Tax=Paraburkholderia tropica TaxID=92647 RepID=UPI0031D45D3F